MKEILETDEYASWVDGLRDKRAQVKIVARIRRLSGGNQGSFNNLGNGIIELKIDYGPGYRIYYTEVNGDIVVLLAGGDKGSQTRDIEKAKRLAGQIRSELA
jgi:putative addiction module killer protein